MICQYCKMMSERCLCSEYAKTLSEADKTIKQGGMVITVEVVTNRRAFMSRRIMPAVDFEKLALTDNAMTKQRVFNLIVWALILFAIAFCVAFFLSGEATR
jgi:hypothetical protein